ncbi:uncharacterized protein AKAME5_000288200, partial [Lates japonicus]
MAYHYFLFSPPQHSLNLPSAHQFTQGRADRGATGEEIQNLPLHRQQQQPRLLQEWCRFDGDLVDCSVAWCGNNHLLLNEAKTVDIAVTSRRTGTMLNTISTLEEEVEVAKAHYSKSFLSAAITQN